MLQLKPFVAWLSVPQLISWGTLFYSFAVFLGPVEKELGLSRLESSAAFSLALLIEGLLAYPVGRWIDRGEGRVVMTGGSLLAAMGLFLLGQASGRLEFYLAWALIGASMAMVLYNAGFAVVIRQFPLKARRGITAITLVGGLASTAFIPLTVGLVGGWGWRGAALGLAALNLAVCLPIHAWALKGLVRPDKAGQGKPSKLPRLTIARPRSYFLVGVFLIMMMAVTAALPAHLVSLLQELPIDPSWVVIVPASLGVAQVLGRLVLFLGGSRSDGEGLDRWAPFAIPLSLVLLLLAVSVPPLVVLALVLFVLVFGTGNGLLTVVKSTAVFRYVQRENAASLNGALGVPYALARAGTPLVVGWVWSPESGYLAGLWILLGIATIGVVALRLVLISPAPADGATSSS